MPRGHLLICRWFGWALLLGSCTQDAALVRELAALRKEVAALREELYAQRAATPGTATPESRALPNAAAPPKQAAAVDAAAPGAVVVRFQIEPADAALYVNGRKLESRELRVPVEAQISVRIERTGYRTLEQLVTIHAGRSLTYRLRRGRGLDARATEP